MFGVFISQSVYAAGSAIRIKCKNGDSETKIFVNNTYKGRCPGADVFLDAGKVTIKARKLDGDYEQVFSKKIELIEGVPQRVFVMLGERQLTREAVARRKKAENQRLIDAYKKDIKAARKGDLPAMKRVVGYYSQGQGVAKSASKAAYWNQKVTEMMVQKEAESAESGDVEAIKSQIARYQRGDGVKADQGKVSYWQDKLEQSYASDQLRQAKSGDLTAMQAMAERYTTGKGVDKDASQAELWRERVARKQEEINKAQLKRENQKKIDKIDYMAVGGAMAGSLDMNDPADSSLWMTSSPVATALDLISTPFKLTYQISLSTEVAAHPSVWAKPDSMVAKAYLQQQQQQRSRQEDDNLLANAK